MNVTTLAMPERTAPHKTSIHIRRLSSAFGVFITGLCASAAALAMLIILFYVAVQGSQALNVGFFTHLPRPVGIDGGGVANGIVGSAITVGIATLIATPVGVLIGIFLALFARGALAESVRFLADVLSGIPSIAIGLFAYALLVAPLHHFSAISAAFAFAVLMMPIIIRTSESAIASVPRTIREGALALGLSSYRATMHVIIPAARPAIITGVLLGIARITGETAPLLFTAFGSEFWELNPKNPMAELALQVFNYAISPYDSWHRQAWGGALILIVAVFALNLIARAILLPRRQR